MSVKTAQTDFEIHPLIAERWSPIGFSSDPIPDDILFSLFEAARWAPSASNRQPWEFIFACKSNEINHQQMLKCLKESNQVWARHAPILAIAIAMDVIDGRPRPTARYDLGLAVMNLSIQALSRQIYVHQMGGIYPDRIRETYRLPDTRIPITALAIGYRLPDEALTPEMLERDGIPRIRKPLSSFVFEGDYQYPSG
ncbi:MAG: nitroreductase family protein [Anaerolineaceae bacterium]|nr:nitroreductase family protein [Anaerolineaceae bacterium]